MLRVLFLLLAFISGAVALSHELLWTRRLIDLLGATEAVTGRVLGLFFLGLSLGGWLATGWSKSSHNAAARLAIAEFLIAVCSLPAIFLPSWADGIVVAMGTQMLVSVYGQLVKALLVAAVVLPPAIAMGTTMPMFIQVMAKLKAPVRRGGVWIYTINMIGGVVGLCLVSTWLLERTGVQNAMLLAAAGNVLIAVASLILSRRIRSLPSNEADFQVESTAKPPVKLASDIETPEDTGANPRPNRKFIFVLAFLSGAVVLASEVLILRLLALVAPSSLQTTSALLANVILFLAIGSAAVALLNRFKVPCEVQLILGAAGAAVFCFLCPVFLYDTTERLVNVRYLAARGGQTIDSIAQYWWILCQIVAVSSGAAMFFFGLVFPSIMSLHSRSDPSGRSIGLLLAVNGLGGLLGAEFANQLMVCQIGIYQGFIILAAITAVISIGVCIVNGRGSAVFAIGCVAVLVVISNDKSYQSLRYLSPAAKNKFKIEETQFGREGVLMVVRDDSGARSILMNNQYILGSSGARAEQLEKRQLQIPWLLHPKSNDICCLGFATGISASGLECLNDPPNITAVELSANVLEVAREYFSHQHGQFFQRPGNRVLLEDARTFMACAEGKYDIVVADLFRPHGNGESRLFSVEHFRNVKRALREDGLVFQWLPAHQLNQQQFKTIASSFLEVFPNTLAVAGGIDSQTPVIGICAWKDGRKWNTEDLTEKVNKVRDPKFNITDKLTLYAQLLILGELKSESFANVPTNTLDNAMLEIDAGRFWITKDLRSNRPSDNLEDGFLAGPNWKAFVQWLMENSRSVLSPIYRQQYLDILK